MKFNSNKQNLFLHGAVFGLEMNIFRFLLAITLIANDISGAQRKITFYEKILYEGASKDYPYEDKCVNLDPEWRNKARSLYTYSSCIIIFAKTDCRGESASIFPLTRGPEFLSEVNFDSKVVSFKKCDKTVEVPTSVRPTYLFTVYDDKFWAGASRTFSVTSGECLTLPKEWHNRISSIHTIEQCFVVFDDINCTGGKKYLSSTYVFSGSPPTNANNLAHYGFNDVVKSIKTCEMTFQAPCDSSCPRFLYTGSPEYTFWAYYFSIISLSHRKQFEERIKRSDTGYISWDFALPSGAVAPSVGYQYQDVLEIQRLMLRVLRVSRPARWNFNSENIETLLALATNVHKERTEQKSKFKDNWNDHNFGVIVQLNNYWGTLEWYLGEILQIWQQDDSNDICGLVEDKTPENLGDTVTLINDGKRAVYGDDPWHAAIYRRLRKGESPEIICGATLISRTVLVSAAHCFYDKGLKQAMNDTSEYEIAVAKYTRDYTKRDGNSQKFHKVKDLIFWLKGYNPGFTGTHNSDIILIILEEPVTIDGYVRPVCLDWDGSVFASLSESGVLGHIVGWGITVKNGNNFLDVSPYLLQAELPYISYTDCVGKVNHLTNDNFCGGSVNGQGAQSGDSGGGYVFKYKNRYYLRGIVSTKDKSTKTSISAFTDLSAYIHWIRKYVS